MGVVQGITHDQFPKQGSFFGKSVEVCFHYNLLHKIRGKVVRDDAEGPGLMIIRLEDGRHVLSTECQYSYQATPADGA